MNYESGDDIVKDVMVEWKDTFKTFDEVLAPLLEGLDK